MRPLDRLLDSDRPLIADHLKRLDAADRRLRFGSALSDGAVDAYVARIDLERGRLFGLVEGNRLHALAEVFEAGPETVEAAFTVDSDRRGQGLCGALIDRILRAAAVAGQQRVILYIQSANRPMRRAAARHGFALRHEDGELVADRRLPPASPLDRALEVADTAQAAFRRLAAGAAIPAARA